MTPRIISWLPYPCVKCGAELVSPVTMQWSDNVTVESVVGPGYPPGITTLIHECERGVS